MDNYMEGPFGRIHHTFDQGSPWPSAPFRAVACKRFCSHQNVLHLEQFPRVTLIPSVSMCSSVFYLIPFY